MPVTPRLASATALALVICAPAARADLSADEVWADWKGYLAGMGYEVSGSEAQSGAVLTVSDAALTMRFPEEEGQFGMDFGTLTFTEGGDGTVTVTWPEKMPMTISATAETGESWEAAIDLTQAGMQITASGAPDDIVYDYGADSIAMMLTDLTIDGEQVAESDASGQMGIEGLEGRTAVKVGEMRDIDQSGTAERLTYTLKMTDPDGSTADISGSAETIDFSGTLSVPLEPIDSSDPSAMFAAGATFDSTMRFGSNATTVNGTGQDGVVRMNTTSEGGDLKVTMSEAGLSYDIAQNGLSVALEADAAPLPIAFDVGQIALNLMMPLTESDAAQDFALGARLAGLTVSDAIWSIFDPQGQLPRDPATAAFDLTGKARIDADFLDPSFAPDGSAAMEAPGQVESLSINELRLDAVGAELTGTGDFAFDNSQPATGPVPDGSVQLTLSGGNALLDKLVAIGILPQEQAMGARMMLGLFGVPSDQPDTLTSKIDFLPDGQILANGQRIR
ncbi:DUF2125 domain-containing protein [Sulfitobacter sp. D35]|uniref:DUF2125 domain-containing protein n=1 Tax=Sulfitobacter sp. D35 TaxID=3083252 RepID=UPI00296E2D0B|nr:DUF2125 domain-containing protein [Sulfitobacter sp. D35]MDW4498329.1 DUF2125 domain-containing protein [Sulfitobacter sp. D35]